MYPSYNADKYSQLMDELQRFSSGPSQSLLSITAQQARNKKHGKKSADKSHVHTKCGHMTHDLHSILVSMERYYHNLDAVDDNYDDLNMPM